MLNTSICRAAIICFVVAASAQAQADEPREKVASSAERIARARWQPIRQPLDESLEELPLPTPSQTHAVPGPFIVGDEIVDGGVYEEGSLPFDERYAEGEYYGFDDGFAPSCDGGCDGYGQCGNCDGCQTRRGWNPLFCVCVPTDGWFSAEYLMWWQKGMRLPPLVTTSSSTANAGVLGRDTTSILYGGSNDHLDDGMNGMRFRLGFWLDPCRTWGIEGEHFGLETQRESFGASGNGSPILSRPFFNMDTNAEDAELVSFPDVVNGSVNVNVSSQLEGTAVHFRRLLSCGSGCATLAPCCIPRGYCSRVEGMLGWRRLQLRETLRINEDLEATDGTAQFDIEDRFNTRTHFNGFNFGLLYHRRRGCYTLDILGRFAIGTNRQSVDISGTTVLTTDSSQTFDSGIFALPSNIGTYERNRFAVVPEIGITGGYFWTPNLRFTLGYTFLYWNNVVRPGDQVDLDIDPNLFPPTGATPTASSRPRFRFNEIDYWVQGWSIGAEYRF